MDWKDEHERRDEEILLPSHEHDHEHDHEESQNGELEGRNSIKGTLFVILGTTATLAGRKVLRDGFRELIATCPELVSRC